MTGTKQPTLLDLIRQHKRGQTTTELPDHAPLEEVVAAGAANSLGQFAVYDEAYSRLHAFLLKEIFGLAPVFLPTGTMFSFKLKDRALLVGAQRSARGDPPKPTPVAAPAPPQMVSADQIRRFLPELREAGFDLQWLNHWCATKQAIAVQPAERTADGSSARKVSPLVDMQNKRREKELRDRAALICTAAGVTGPQKPCDLYPAITIQLVGQGFKSEQVSVVQDNPSRLPIECREGRKHVAEEIVFHILSTKTPPYPPVRAA